MPVRRLASRALRSVARACDRLARRVWDSPEVRQARRVRPWKEIQGDRTLRLDYDLDRDSLLFDVGGYQGQWASDMAAMYGCRILIFEPVPGHFDAIRKRFRRNPLIEVHPFGLAGRTRTERIGVAADGSSIYRDAAQGPEVRLVKAGDFLREHRVGRIDVMKINIEGGEYELLEHLIEEGWTASVLNFQVQFHDFVPGAESRMRAIQEALEKTHSLTYQYPFVWENWRLTRFLTARGDETP